MNPRLFRLIETHRRIDDALRREQQRPAGDWQRLQKLKRLKLRAKEAMVRLMQRKTSLTA